MDKINALLQQSKRSKRWISTNGDITPMAPSPAVSNQTIASAAAARAAAAGDRASTLGAHKQQGTPTNAICMGQELQRQQPELPLRRPHEGARVEKEQQQLQEKQPVIVARSDRHADNNDSDSDDVDSSGSD